MVQCYQCASDIAPHEERHYTRGHVFCDESCAERNRQEGVHRLLAESEGRSFCTFTPKPLFEATRKEVSVSA